MPRALLLKKRKFNSEEAEESKKPDVTNKKQTNCKELRKEKTRISSVKKNNKKFGNDFHDDKPLSKRNQSKKKSSKQLNVKVNENLDTNSEDDENNWNSQHVQQHYVKLMKKDGHTKKVWECGICHKEFLHQYTLMRHVPIHTDVRNFKCDVCDKAFRQASTLCRHKAIHSDERPFMCSVCGKAFNRSSTLIAHRKTHSELKRHTCHVCGKGFHQKGNLKNHIYTHTGERPYKCDKCGRGFNQTSNLMCHKAHAHVEKPRHICQSCGKEFPRRFSLRIHEEYKHGIKYDVTGEPRMDPDKFNEMFQTRNLKRGKNSCSASKTIILPNGDKTIEFSSPSNLPCSSCEKKLINNEVKSQDQDPSTCKPELTTNVPLFSQNTGLLIDPITTPATKTAQQNNQILFALFRPAKGVPILVKILCTVDGKQVLIPATAEDLKSDPNAKPDGVVQVKVPLVATVIQKENADGKLIIEVEPVEDNTKNKEAVKEETSAYEQTNKMQMTCTESKGAITVVDEMLNSEIVFQTCIEEGANLTVSTEVCESQEFMKNVMENIAQEVDLLKGLVT